MDNDEPRWLLSATGDKLHNPEDPYHNGLYQVGAICDTEVRLSIERTNDHAREGIKHARCQRCEKL